MVTVRMGAPSMERISTVVSKRRRCVVGLVVVRCLVGGVGQCFKIGCFL